MITCVADELAEVLPSWSWATVEVGGVLAAPHGTSDVDGGVACDAAVIAVGSHG